jgi:hypothetical protein
LRHRLGHLKGAVAYVFGLTHTAAGHTTLIVSLDNVRHALRAVHIDINGIGH